MGKNEKNEVEIDRKTYVKMSKSGGGGGRMVILEAPNCTKCGRDPVKEQKMHNWHCIDKDNVFCGDCKE